MFLHLPIWLRCSMFFIAALCHASASRAEAVVSAADFSSYGGNAAFSTQTAEAPAKIWYGKALAESPSTPASTFKVLLALVALETGALKSPVEVVPWNRERYPGRPEWEKPMALREAMQSSSESYFQTLAARIGSEQLKTWVERLRYGNQKVGKAPKRPWLDGTLQISSLQQLAFMEQMRQGQLPIAKHHVEAVKQSMLDREYLGPQGVIRVYGKTGSSMTRDNQAGIGWWVGFVEDSATPKNSSSFALRVSLQKLDNRAERIGLANTLLQRLGLLAIDSSQLSSSKAK